MRLDKHTVMVLAGIGGLAMLLIPSMAEADAPYANVGPDEDPLDAAMTAFDEATMAPANTPSWTPTISYTDDMATDYQVPTMQTDPNATLPVNMQASDAVRTMLKRSEALRLTRYALGDGGYTWGYGHFEKNPNALPETITEDQANAIFAQDLAERAEKWVKLYVTVPLTQNQYDALTHIAYNMTPQSFKKFANSVNAGNGITQIAQDSIAWVAAKFTNGITNRRNAEINLYNNGVYA